MIVPFNKWACPLDNLPMKRMDNSLVCEKNHSYDYARSGYIHLLPSHFKHSAAPGDNAEMVSARQMFLNSGAYHQILETVMNRANEYFRRQSDNNRSTYCLVDAGCGEGYYTVGLAEGISATFPKKSVSMLGFDISKNGVVSAAKRFKQIDWAVATNSHIPVQSGSVDCLFSLFGFPVLNEFLRILKSNGILITADAGQNHLIELRQSVYDTITAKETAGRVLTDNDFVLSATNTILYQLTNLTFETVDALLKMTPHFYRMPAVKYEQFKTIYPSTITVDVIIRVYRRQ